MEYYYNEKGKIAVLVSPGYGAGWSTWSYDHGIALATDKRIVEKFLECQKVDGLLRKIGSYGSEERTELQEWLASIGYPDVYVGGFADIVVKWVSPGTAIRINEYDGFETLETNYEGYTTL